MRSLRMLFIMIAAVSVLLLPSTAAAHPENNKADHHKEVSAATQRAKIDGIARNTLDKLFASSPDARALFDRAYGYAVFDNSKVSLGLSGAGGAGVAAPKTGGHKTYMKMGSGGIGVGVGYQEYQVVFLFENEASFNHFVNEGWTADASATVVGGNAGASVAGDFNNGIALFKLNEKGLAVNADVSGTKYWKDKKLNT
jgi:lipid-binding SYLF domain-containing protein